MIKLQIGHDQNHLIPHLQYGFFESVMQNGTLCSLFSCNEFTGTTIKVAAVYKQYTLIALRKSGCAIEVCVPCAAIKYTVAFFA